MHKDTIHTPAKVDLMYLCNLLNVYYAIWTDKIRQINWLVDCIGVKRDFNS